MIHPKLSICISGLHARYELYARLMTRLCTSARIGEVEILTSLDSGHKTTGIKRNQLVARAIGDYIVHIDDDDLVSESYVPSILAAIDAHSPDVVLVRGERTDAAGQEKTVQFDYKLMDERGKVEHEHPGQPNECWWRNPGHLCPIRSTLAKMVSFPIKEPEDLVWSDHIWHLLKTSARAGEADEVLYHYLWSSKKFLRYM